MGFNYAKERRKFEAEWRKLRREYEQAGMTPDAIDALYDFDLDGFRSRRRYETWTQPMPDGYPSEDRVGTPSLRKNYKRLSTTFDEADFSGETAWLDTIEDPALLKRLRKLSKKDLELLRFLVLEEHTQEELARKWHCSQSSISNHFLRIKKFLRNFLK